MQRQSPLQWGREGQAARRRMLGFKPTVVRHCRDTAGASGLSLAYQMGEQPVCL
jgi:hypothetical protein